MTAVILFITLLAGACSPSAGRPTTTGSTTEGSLPVTTADLGVSWETHTDPDRGIAISYPNTWVLAGENLTPNLGNGLSEILTVATFPLRKSGPTCAHFPVHALHDLGPEDVLVTLQERTLEAGFGPEGFGQRPTSFRPELGFSQPGLDAVYCMDPAEREDLGTVRWIWFAEQGRFFHLLVVIGSEASSQTRDQAIAVLDSMIIDSLSGTPSVDSPPDSSTVTVLTSMPAIGDSLFENPAEAATAVARAQNPDLVDPRPTQMVVIYADATTVDLRVQIQAKGFCQWYGVSAQVQGGALQWSAQPALPCSP